MDIMQHEHSKQQREAAQQRRAILQAADFKAVLESAEGRRFVYRILAEGGIYQSSFNSDPLVMAYNEGRRALALWLQSLFADCPELYLRLIQEKNTDDDSP